MATIQFSTHHGNFREIKTVENVELTPQGVDAAYKQTSYGSDGWLVEPGNSMHDYRVRSMEEAVSKLSAGDRVEFGWTDAYVVEGDY